MEIFPSANELPANTVRFYLVFERDMRGTVQRRNISLQHDGGDGGASSSIPLGPMSWRDGGMCVAIVIDGRRRADTLDRRHEIPPPLVPGHRYAMFVRESVGKNRRRSITVIGFNVGEVDRRSLDASRWKLNAPQVGTREPLQVRFGRVMDRFSLLGGVGVLDHRQHPVKGAVRCAAAESGVAFVPAEPWNSGTFNLRVSPLIEDVCGNRCARTSATAVEAVAGDRGGRHLQFRVR